jgi:hypothetical protein
MLSAAEGAQVVVNDLGGSEEGDEALTDIAVETFQRGALPRESKIDA